MKRLVFVNLVGGPHDGRQIRLTYSGDAPPQAIDVGVPGVARADVHVPPLHGCHRYHLRGESSDAAGHHARYVLEGLNL